MPGYKIDQEAYVSSRSCRVQDTGHHARFVLITSVWQPWPEVLFFFLSLFFLLHESQCSKAMQSLRLPAYMCPCLCLRRPRCPYCRYLILSRPCLSVCLPLPLATLPVLSTVANATHAYPPWLPFVLVQLVHPTPLLIFPFHFFLFFAFPFASSSPVFRSFTTRLTQAPPHALAAVFHHPLMDIPPRLIVGRRGR